MTDEQIEKIHIKNLTDEDVETEVRNGKKVKYIDVKKLKESDEELVAIDDSSIGLSVYIKSSKSNLKDLSRKGFYLFKRIKAERKNYKPSYFD